MKEGILYYASPLGRVTVAACERGVTGLWFEGQRYYMAGYAGDMTERELPALRDARRWLDIYFSGRDPGFTPPLDLRGTPFRLAVWRELLKIPYGSTVSYGELAAHARCSSARAVGSAVGHNPVSLMVPCHRVIGADGALTGYAGGLDRKGILLTMEGAAIADDRVIMSY
ncbi:MAG: 6-O-methylguanine DNA methyltransferase [Clostridiales bacterium]|nr:6-O-methylguanine DNA methyltransferase [Clostridiales bacterium]